MLFVRIQSEHTVHLQWPFSKYLSCASFNCLSVSFQDRGVKEDELQSILNYLLTMHEVHESPSLLHVNSLSVLVCHFAELSHKVTFIFWVPIPGEVYFFQHLKCPARGMNLFDWQWPTTAPVLLLGAPGAQQGLLQLQGTYIMSLLQLQLDLAKNKDCILSLHLLPLLFFLSLVILLYWFVSAGWESAWCAAAGGSPHVWASSFHDPRFRPEKWNTVSPSGGDAIPLLFGHKMKRWFHKINLSTWHTHAVAVCMTSSYVRWKDMHGKVTILTHWFLNMTRMIKLTPCDPIKYKCT